MCIYIYIYIYIYTKLLAVSDNSMAIKVKSLWTLFVILFTSSFISKLAKRLCNIFRTKDAIKLSKTMLESLHKLLQASSKGMIFKWPAQFSKAV